MSSTKLSLKQNMLWNSVGSLVYFGCQWVITVLVVRLSSNFYDAGVLALGMAVANVVTPIGYFRNRALQISDEEGRYQSGQYVALRILTLAASLVFALGYIALTCPPSSALPVFIYCVFASSVVLVDVFHGVDQKAFRMDIIGKSQILRGIASIVVFAACYKGTGSLTITFLAMALVVYGIIFFYDAPCSRKLDSLLKPDFDWGQLRSLFIICIPLCVGLFLCNATSSIPRQLLGDMYGESALGVYASVAAPVAIIQMGANYIYSPVLGVFSKLNHSKERRAFLSLLLKILLAIVSLVVACVVLFELLGPAVLVLLFGNEIEGYMYLLAPLVVNVGLVAVTWFCADLLVVVGDIRGNLVANLIPFVCSVALSHVLLQCAGLNGATFALIIGFGLSTLFCLLRLRRLVAANDVRAG